MAKQATAATARPGLVARLNEFYLEIRAEMKKVAWPTKEDLKSSTSVVIFVLVALAIIIGVFDKIFQLIAFLVFKLG